MKRVLKLSLLTILFLAASSSLSFADPREGEVPLFEDLGNHHHRVSTDSELAQRYFDQGLTLTYAFNHPEAIRAFREAARHDPNLAMAWWGVAYALGPNINAPMPEAAVPEAYAALQKARELAPRASERERAYIEALSKRYAPQPVADRGPLDRAYAEAMKDVANRYPDDLDAATLYAEAIMDTMPWDYWSSDGAPRPATGELLAVLESVMKRNPNHPGANHYYIHAVEASPTPERGLDSALRMGELVPGAGHLVHMPAHIYLQLGRYHQASLANEAAAGVDDAYISRTGAHSFYTMMYTPHNYHFLWYSKAMEGRSAEAIEAARQVSSRVPAEMARKEPMLEVFVPVPLFALARFGMWDEILAEPKPPADLPYPTAVWHYARGLALTAKGRPADAVAEADALTTIAGSEAIREREIPALYAASQLAIAKDVLWGEIAGDLGRIEQSLRFLQAAVDKQDVLPYMEPPYWYYPVRESLGAALLGAGRAGEAEAVFRRDLKDHPHSGRSLFGLERSLLAQGRDEEAQEVHRAFARAWANADVNVGTTAAVQVR